MVGLIWIAARVARLSGLTNEMDNGPAVGAGLALAGKHYFTVTNLACVARDLHEALYQPWR